MQGFAQVSFLGNFTSGNRGYQLDLHFLGAPDVSSVSWSRVTTW